MFKKIFIIYILLFSYLRAEIVNTIQVNGNNRISTETIKVYGEIETGKDYNNLELNKVLKNLYSTDFFENVEIKIENNILIINVKEYQIINSIDLKGEPSNTVKNNILERLQLKNKQSFISSKLSEDINMIKKIYSSIGYNFVKVDYKVENFTGDRVNLLFDVERGNRTYISKINFIGNKVFKDSKLRDVISSEEKKFWKFISQNTYLNQESVELDKRLLLNYYKSLGFYDVQILSSNAEINENNFSELTFNINAGKRFKINKIRTNIDDVLSKENFIDLEKSYTKFIGEYYSPFKVKKILDELEFLIASNDLQFIEHSVNEVLENNNIEIVINIYEGKKEIVERINIFGNNITDESVIRGAFLLDEGDPFSKLKFDQSVAILKSRNLFGEIKTNILDGNTKDQKIIDIIVEEKPTGEITAGAGIGTSGGSFVFEVSENNWLGKGINVATSLNVSKETFSGGIRFNDPNYKFTGNTLNYFIESTKNDKPNSGFKNNVISSGVGTKFEQYNNIYLSPNIIFSYDKLTVDSSASAALKKQKGEFSDISFDYSITTDRRDRVYGPTDGYITSFSQTIPLYADSPFLKNSFSFSKYHSFSDDMIGAIKFYASSINGLEKKDVRLSKRLSLSSLRLRGFEAGKIGPKDGSDYIGGNYLASTNFEVNLPKLLPDSTNIDIGFFLDLANVWHVDYSDDIDNSNKLRSSTGISTNYLSPVGPMSFIFSKNISKASTDVTESFNFRIGTSF